MISPELLRRYPFFARLDDAQLKVIAMISQEQVIEKGTVLFQEGQPADAIYLLEKGGIDLYFTVAESGGSASREYLVDEIDAGEVFGISSLIDPYILTSNARASQYSRIVCIQGAGLRKACEKDQHMAYLLMQQVAKAFAERLHYCRIQLAAARV
ncbi:MAG: Crp/Fnr family transcriptional regulator [Omnitrophica WOR_2 bacterium]